MKAKNLYSLLAVCAAGTALCQTANAQEPVFADEAVSVTKFTCDPATKYYSNWRNNWFIQIGAGINQPFVERNMGNAANTGHAVDRKKMTVTYNFGFGRWFTPYLAFRVNAFGGCMHWDAPTAAQPDNGWTRAKHVNLNAELMWDMLNTFGGVNPDRVFSIIPYVGIGGEYMWDMRDKNDGVPAAINVYNKGGEKRTNSWTLPVSAGIQFRFRLCKYVDFFAEARATFYGDNWNNVVARAPIEANVTAYGGFSFNIGGRGWNSYNECASLSTIASLNNQVNDLRAELIDSAAKIADLSAQLPCPQPVTNTVAAASVPLLSTVRFNINSAVITPEEEVNVFNMAQWLKKNPDENVVVCGYADRDTGTAEYNMELSKRRADAVVDQLVNKYGIAKDRMTVKYDGSDVQPYGENNWNRIVIFSQGK